MPIETSPLVQIKNLDQLEAELDKQKRDLAAQQGNEKFMQGLVGYIRGRWNDAQNAKAENIEARLIACKRAVRCEYHPKKLAAIKQLYGRDFEPPYPPLIATKRRDLIAWMRDFLLRSDVDIFDIEPTPMPDLPEEIRNQIQAASEKKAFETIADVAFQNNRMLSVEMIQSYAKQIKPFIDDEAKQDIVQRAKESVLRMKRKIQDQFKEGGFEEALKHVIDDIGQYPNAFIEGNIQQKVPVQKMVYNAEVDKWEMRVEEQIISRYERFSPMDAFPQPDAKGIEDGYFFRKLAFTRQSLSDLLGVEGFDSDAIERVLEKHKSGGLKEWTTISAARENLEDKSASYDSDKIDCVKYWGSASGQNLLDWAGEKAMSLFGMKLNPLKEYQIILWMIGTDVIKAILNPDPMGKKNIFKADFDEDPDNFWCPTSLPETLWDIQSSVNAISRAIVLNVGFASGPQIEYDKDRFPDGVTPNFYPLKQWASTGNQMSKGKPIEFWQPELLTQQLQQIYEFHRSLADEYSGIPRYMQGEKKGVAPTASGFSMQISQQARGLKSILMNIDFGIIELCVKGQYQFNLQYEDDVDMVGDCKIVAKGAASIVAKEQLAIRRKEFTGEVLGSPVAVQLIGGKGIRELLKASAQSLDLDLDKVFGEDDLANEIAENLPLEAINKGTPPRPAGVNAAGDVASGGDFALNQPAEGTRGEM